MIYLFTNPKDMTFIVKEVKGRFMYLHTLEWTLAPRLDKNPMYTYFSVNEINKLKQQYPYQFFSNTKEFEQWVSDHPEYYL